MNSFVRQFIAAVKGDNTEVEAQKSWRKAESALRAQIATKEGETISLEDKVEAAEEALDSARINNGEEIKDTSKYITNLIKAKNNLTIAKEALEQHLETVNFLETEYELLTKE